MITNSSQHSKGNIITVDEFERRKFVISNIVFGGMGVIYQLLPVDPFDYVVALKTYQHKVPVEQFEREARIWFSIGSHPNIARAFWYGLWDGFPSILAEWYPLSVKDISIDSWKMPELKGFFIGIIEGLKYAYEKSGVIHQDIKPDNILVDKKMNPRITDFGVSALVYELQKKVAGTLA